jgi:acyl carrier protein
MTDTEIRDQLRAFICDALLHNAAYPLGDDDPLITGGLMDSYALAQIGVFVEDAFGLYLPDTELTVTKMDTVALMAARIQTALRRRT